MLTALDSLQCWVEHASDGCHEAVKVVLVQQHGTDGQEGGQHGGRGVIHTVGQSDFSGHPMSDLLPSSQEVHHIRGLQLCLRARPNSFRKLLRANGIIRLGKGHQERGTRHPSAGMRPVVCVHDILWFGLFFVVFGLVLLNFQGVPTKQ